MTGNRFQVDLENVKLEHNMARISNLTVGELIVYINKPGRSPVEKEKLIKDLKMAFMESEIKAIEDMLSNMNVFGDTATEDNEERIAWRAEVKLDQKKIDDLRQKQSEFLSYFNNGSTQTAHQQEKVKLKIESVIDLKAGALLQFVNSQRTLEKQVDVFTNLLARFSLAHHLPLAKKFIQQALLNKELLFALDAKILAAGILTVQDKNIQQQIFTYVIESILNTITSELLVGETKTGALAKILELVRELAYSKAYNKKYLTEMLKLISGYVLGNGHISAQYQDIITNIIPNKTNEATSTTRLSPFIYIAPRNGIIKNPRNHYKQRNPKR